MQPGLYQLPWLLGLRSGVVFAARLVAPAQAGTQGRTADSRAADSVTGVDHAPAVARW